MSTTHFQYCQKIIVFSPDLKKILLCKRKGEADYDGIFSFIGGKMETSDENILEWLKREKDEEVGENFKIKIYPTFSTNAFFRKKDGNAMILPHYLSIYESWEIELNEEYSEYQWVAVKELESFEPKIPNIPKMINLVLRLKKIMDESELVVI